MDHWLLLPPIAFALVLLVSWLEYRSLAVLSAGETWDDAPGKRKPYACGEDVADHRVQPNYGQFFSFAFFFTIMHVVALMAATLPAGSTSAAFAAVLYVAACSVALCILYQR